MISDTSLPPIDMIMNTSCVYIVLVMEQIHLDSGLSIEFEIMNGWIVWVSFMVEVVSEDERTPHASIPQSQKFIRVLVDG
jgi:hypothetical protein